MNSRILAIVGMPGSGKSTVCSYLGKLKIPFVHFGDITKAVLIQKGLSATPESERTVREQLRKDQGMEVYAIKSLRKIRLLLKKNKIIGIDGLYSWEEYIVLLKEFPEAIIIIHIFTDRNIRYQRLANRYIRPLSPEQAFARDMSEIEKLHKSGPIAMADYIVNNNGTKEQLYVQVEELLNL